MPSENTHQYLTFTLDGESFAIEILKVREVLDYETPVRIPRSPESLVGVINLRGNVVPVVDMRCILGLPPGEIGKESCIIIVETVIEDDTITVGALADSVQKVIDLPASAIGPPPKIGTKLKIELLRGIGKVQDTFIMILNMNKVLSLEELNQVDETLSITPELFTEKEATIEGEIFD
jgi:purine-binding chemotaxis protein CheW